MATFHGSIGSISASSPSWLMPDALSQINAETPFSKAAELWLESRNRRRLSGPTIKCYRGCIKSLHLFFGSMSLGKIRLDFLKKYQETRLVGAEPFIRFPRFGAKEKESCPAKPQQVNQELNVLISILKCAKLWLAEYEELFQSLNPEINELPRALTLQEQRKWIQTAASHPRWQVVYWYSLLAFDTCTSPNELRALRLGDINLPSRALTIPAKGAKNKFRQRTIAIVGDEAVWALENLIRRAHSLGSSELHHYLFPYGKRGGQNYDPARSMTSTGLRRAWEEIRNASSLPWFRMYDTRHTAITRLAEAGVSVSVIKKRAGHVTSRMTEHYTHLSEGFEIQEVKRAYGVFGDRLSGRQDRPSYAAVPPPMQIPSPPPSILPQLGNLTLTPEVLRALADIVEKQGKQPELTGHDVVTIEQ